MKNYNNFVKYFNFYYNDDVLDGISLFDASGHGVAASLITMLAENVIRQVYENSPKKNKDLAKKLNVINESFIQAKGDVDNYLTGILLNIQEKDNGKCILKLANAAHPYPIIYKKLLKSIYEVLPPKGKESYGPIGIRELETQYNDFEFEMEKGDILVLFTDGLTETMNFEREEFGRERIAQVLKEDNRKSADSILQSLLHNLNEHTGSELRTDDVTVIILKRK